MQLIKIEQRTSEWHAWRDGKDLPDGLPRITATTASIVAGTSRFKTKHQLWREMTGKEKPAEVGFAAKKGAQKEDVVLQHYIQEVGFRVAPVCIQSSKTPWVAASLDGLHLKRRRAAEFKCNGRETHEMAAKGEIPPYYTDQIQWQMFASDNEIEAIDYYSFPWNDNVEQKGILIRVYPDELRQKQLFQWADEFRNVMLKNDVPPYSTEWEFTAKIWRLAHQRKEVAEAELEDAKEKLIALLPETKKFEGAGVIVSSLQGRKGSVDMKLATAEFLKSLESKGIDPSWAAAEFDTIQEKCRKPDGKESFTIRPHGEISGAAETANSGVQAISSIAMANQKFMF